MCVPSAQKIVHQEHEGILKALKNPFIVPFVPIPMNSVTCSDLIRPFSRREAIPQIVNIQSSIFNLASVYPGMQTSVGKNPAGKGFDDAGTD